MIMTATSTITAARRPPMLGSDIEFRSCCSPESAKFETDQAYDLVPSRSEDGGGLWGGYCVAHDEDQYLLPANRGPALIATPRRETMECGFSTPPNGLHPTMTNGNGHVNGNGLGLRGVNGNTLQVPGSENGVRFSNGSKTPRTRAVNGGGLHMLAGLTERLSFEANRTKYEEELEQEFDDTFVTQVYNYLSLGYPSMARQYDGELSRISQIPESELRKDDYKVDAKGHIGLAEAPTTNLKGRCARWDSLRLYIREWAKQHPLLADGISNPINWGPKERRGSWAA